MMIAPDRLAALTIAAHQTAQNGGNNFQKKYAEGVRDVLMYLANPFGYHENATLRGIVLTAGGITLTQEAGEDDGDSGGTVG